MTRPEHWKEVRSRKIWGVDNRYKLTIRRLKPKVDLLIFYVTDIMAFMGVYDVVSEPYYDEIPIWSGGIYPHRIKINPLLEKSISIKELFDELLFITNRKKGRGGWSDHLQFSMVSICDEDYKTICSRIKDKHLHITN